MTNRTTRYATALIVLHWLLAALILLALLMGSLSLAGMPNTSPDKVGALRGHMIVGTLIGLLMLVRLVVRWRLPRPAPARTGRPALDLLSRAVHVALYLLVFAMAGSGVAMALAAGLPEIVFGGAGALPERFDHLLPRAVHGVVALALMGLVGLHVAGALYHQFVRRDRLLARMGIGKA
jgi:cytochrome b561